MAFKLNRTNDAVFKAVFARNPQITLSLINAFFEFQGTELIADIEFIDRELDGEQPDDKESRLDILGKTGSGEKVNIEMQVNAFEAMGERSLFYWARNYIDLKKGEGYDCLKRTVAINILGFDLFDREKYPAMHSCFGLYDIKTKCQLTRQLEIHFLELSKFKPQNSKNLTRMEKWAAYFSPDTPENELTEIAETEAAIREAMEVEELFTQSEIARRAYDKAEKFRRDQKALLSYTRKEARQEGYEDGREYGRIEGRVEGKSEGMIQKAESIALAMLRNNKSIDEVQMYTELSVTRLSELARSLS